MVANSKWNILDPDRNPVLHILLRKLFYDHFVAGENVKEVQKTVASMKRIGFKGVILGYTKEVNVSGGEKTTGEVSEATVQAWKSGTLETLNCIGEGDFLAVKYSGAGAETLAALAAGSSPPSNMWSAMLDICHAASKQKTRIWIDAEQQDLQPTINEWTMELMRSFNRNEQALVYNTMQAYLKITPNVVLRHLQIAQREGWVVGIKLVRGAYIATEVRSLIHDSIEDTHQAYDEIAEYILRQNFPGVGTYRPYPRTELFIATHNDESIAKAYAIQRGLVLAGQSTIEIGFGQLQGMADEASCRLLQLHRTVQTDPDNDATHRLAPNAYKCLSWGTTREALQFLIRRVQENGDALKRTEFWVEAYRIEIWRRLRKQFRWH